MHEAHLFRAGVEVEAHGEGQEAPVAISSRRSSIRRLCHSIRRGEVIATLDFHHGTHIACPFHFHLFHMADIVLEMDVTHAFHIRLILCGADELSCSCHTLAAKDEAVQDGIPALGDVGSEVFGTNLYMRFALLHLKAFTLLLEGERRGVPFFLRFLEHHILRTSRHDGCESAPFHRAVRPVSRRPEVGSDGLALFR